MYQQETDSPLSPNRIVAITVITSTVISGVISFILAGTLEIEGMFRIARILSFVFLVASAIPGYATSQPGADEIGAQLRNSAYGGGKFNTQKARSQMSEYGSNSSSVGMMISIGSIVTFVLSQFMLSFII